MKRERASTPPSKGSSRDAQPLANQDLLSAEPRWKLALSFALIACLAIAVYANTLGNGLVYDDKNILLSPLLHDPWNLSAVFDNRFYPDNGQDYRIYRPLSNLGYLVNHRVNELLTGSGENAAGFHLVGLLMHAGVACLFFLWLLRLELARAVALSAAAIFAVLPVHSEAVACVYNRSEMQAALFGLAFLILHRRGAWFFAAPALLLAAWSKESGILFLPLALATDLLLPDARRAGTSFRSRMALLPYAVYAGGAGLWLMQRADVLASVPESSNVIENPLRDSSLLVRILTACKLQLAYLRLQIAPLQLSSDYSLRQIPLVTRWGDLQFLAACAVFIGAGLLAWIARRKRPLVSLAFVGYATLFALTSNFLVPIGTLMAERLAYAPSLFFCLLLALAAWATKPWLGTRAVCAAMVLLVAGYSAKTFAQNRIWHDELTLFAEQARTAPNSAKAHLNYAGALGALAASLEQRAKNSELANSPEARAELEAELSHRYREELAQIRQSLAIFDQYADSYLMLGTVLYLLHANPEEVIAAYQNAIRLEPTHIRSRVNLATILIEHARFDEARAQVNEIERLDPLESWLPWLRKKLP